MFKYAKKACKSDAKIAQLMSQVEAAITSQTVKDSLHLAMTRDKLSNTGQGASEVDRARL